MGDVSLISSFLCFSTYMNYANVRQRACTRDIQYTCRAQGFSICICSIPVNAAEQDVTFFFFQGAWFCRKNIDQPGKSAREARHPWFQFAIIDSNPKYTGSFF